MHSWDGSAEMKTSSPMTTLTRFPSLNRKVKNKIKKIRKPKKNVYCSNYYRCNNNIIYMDKEKNLREK